MANVAQLCNNLHALFLSGGNNLITTPTYHVFDMYKAHQGAKCVRVLTENIDAFEGIEGTVSVSASRKDGKVLLTLGNFSLTEDAELQLEFLGARVAPEATVTLLSAEDVRMHNTFECPDAIAPVRCTTSASSFVLPKASIAAIEFTVAD